MNVATADEISDTMKANIIKIAKEKPWSWQWKFLTAIYMLNTEVPNKKGVMGKRSIQFVKKLLGVTYQDLLRWNVIEYINIKDKKGNVLARRMAVVAHE